MIKHAIAKIVDKQDLTYDEAYEVMNEIMSGQTSPTQNAAFLAALSTKSTKAETIDEISGCAAAMRDHATPVEHPGLEVLDIVGTGGDGAHSFNISTTAAMAPSPASRHSAPPVRVTSAIPTVLSNGVNNSADRPPRSNSSCKKAVISSSPRTSAVSTTAHTASASSSAMSGLVFFTSVASSAPSRHTAAAFIAVSITGKRAA